MNREMAPARWRETSLKVGAWGLLLVVLLMIFVAVPLMALSI